MTKTDGQGRSPLEARVVTYAFEHDEDLDRAAYVVLTDEFRKGPVGLYDRLFGKRGGK